MAFRSKDSASTLVNKIYGPSGIIFSEIHSAPVTWGTTLVKLLQAPFFAFRDIRRLIWYCTYYRLRCFLHMKYQENELAYRSGMLCWNLATSSEELDRSTSGCDQPLRRACQAVFDDIRLGCIGGSNDFESRSPILTYIRVPRDIIFIYVDQDANVLRKLELRHNVRIFQGRDYERGRDRDRPQAPRGTARLCVHGRYENVMAAKREIFGWLQLQGDFKEEEILIPEFATGNVIGRQGGRVAKIQVQSKARIDVQTRDERNRQPSDDVKIMVSGRRPARDAARKLLMECVAHSERMQERDRVRDSIRDVRRRIMYGAHDDETEQESNGMEAETLVTRPAESSPLMFKPRSVQMAEARMQWKGKEKVATQWGNAPAKTGGAGTTSETTPASWAQGYETWAQ